MDWWDDAKIWLAIGFAGNAIFASRFLVQWLASERAGRSYVPVVFWWLSIAGSLILLLYALHRRDPVFTLAYLPNCVIYVRNLMLIRRERRERARHEREERHPAPAAQAPVVRPAEPSDAEIGRAPSF